MSHALTTRTDSLPAEREWATMLSMAEVLFKSGMLPAHIKSAAATVAIVQKGRELGIPPMHALSNIAVIQGKPTANSELMLALIYRDHGDDAMHFLTSNGEECSVGYKRRAWKEYRKHTFTHTEAKAAGLVKQGPWMQYPAAMLRARCVSAVARMAFPDSIGGMYTPEEMGAEVDGDGQVVAPPPPPIRAIAQPAEDKPALIEDRQMRKLWVLAKQYYGDKQANAKLHDWIGEDYPTAVGADGAPSIRALTIEQASAAIAILEESIAIEAVRASVEEPEGE